MSISILEGAREVKRINTLIRVEVDIEVGTSDRIDQCLVLILWIEDNHIRSEHECTQYFELDGKRFSSSRFREDTHVRIFCPETVEDNERIVVGINPIEYPIIL